MAKIGLISVCILFSTFCMHVAVVQSQSAVPQEFTEARKSYEAEQAKAIKTVNERYQPKVEELKKQLTFKGNLKGALAAEEAAQKLSSGQLMVVNDNDPQELKDIKRNYEQETDAAVNPLRSLYVAKLEVLKQQLALGGDLKGALVVEEGMNKTKEEADYRLPISKQELTNGSFELPGGLPPNSGINIQPGDPRLIGWTIGGPAAIAYNNGRRYIQGTPFPPPVDGAYHLEFNGGDASPGAWIAQTFDSVVDEVYEVSFYVGRLGPGAGAMQLDARILAGDGHLITNRIAIPPAHGYGGVQQFTFIASSSRTTIQFVDTSSATGSVDVLLDAVSVTSLRELQGQRELQKGI